MSTMMARVPRVEAAVLERWLLQFLDDVEAEGRFPTIQVASRGAGNVEAVLGESATGHECIEFGARLTKKMMSAAGAASYAGILAAAAFCHHLSSEGRFATQRELYYLYKGAGFSPWATQAECNESIRDVAQLFGTDRASLGLTTSARGCIAGRLRARRPGGEWIDFNEGVQAIDHDWITAPRELDSDARCIVVVEKDGIFRRLVDDGFCDRRPCILVTGCGVPDVATRCCVHTLRTALRVPVYGVVDWNPYGAGILVVYKLGSSSGIVAESQKYAVDVRWLGLRSSQIEHAGIPAACMQPMSVHDTRRARGLVDHRDWLPATWRDEIEKQLEVGSKCELEALISSSGFDNVADFVHVAIARGDFLA